MDLFSQQKNRSQPGTIVIMIILILIYFIINYRLEPRALWIFSLIPYHIERKAYWKLFTAPLIHSSFPHLIFDISLIWQRFSHIEKRAGLFFLFFHLFLFSFLIGLIYSFIIIIFTIAGYTKCYYKPLFGMTSNIIALNVIESQLSTSPTSSLFGVVHVPSKLMPFLLIITSCFSLSNAATLCYFCALGISFIYFQIFRKQLIKYWSTQQELLVNRKGDESSAPFLLPSNVISTFEVDSPLGEEEDKSENLIRF